MKQNSTPFFSFIVLLIVFLGGYGYFVYAAAPPGGYTPGQTLNPDCAPGDSDCIVALSGGGLITADNGLTATGSNVQLGGTLTQTTTIDQDGNDFTLAETVPSTNGMLVFAQGLTTVTGLPGTVQGYIASNGDAARNISWLNTGDGMMHTLAGSGDPSLVRGGTEITTSYDPADTTSGLISLYAFDTPNTHVTRFQVTPTYIDAQFDPTAEFRLNGDPGTAGYVLTSNGIGIAPVWQAKPISINGSTLYSSGLTGTGNTSGNNIFLGENAGNGATGTYSGNFFGQNAGNAATNAQYSNFLGFQSGYNASNAANSIFIGKNAGYGDLVNNTVSGSSIAIGDSAGTGGNSNSIALGASAINTLPNQFLIGSSYTNFNVRGINYVWPAAQAAGSGYVLTNDGSGGLSWSTGLSIGGTSGQLQYNNAGALGGVSGITFDGTNFDAKDSVFRIVDNSDTTKRAIFEVSGIDAGTTRTYTLPNTAGTIALTSDLSGYLKNSIGISGGTTLVGGTASGESLTLSSTSNATKGKILFGTSAYNESNNRLGLRTTNPGSGAIYIQSSGAEVEDGITWSNGARIGYFTAANATIEAVTGGSLMFKSKSQTGLRLSDNSGNQAFSFAMVDQTTTTNQTIVFGGDYSGGYRSVGTTVAGIDRNGSTLSFFANSGAAGSYASFTPNKILTIDGANSRVGIGTTTPSSALEIANGGTLKLGGGTAINQGNILMNSNASNLYDTNLIYLGSNSQTMGMIASSTPAFLSSYGPSIFLRGNSYGAISGQRGNAGLIAGNPSSPTAGEGELRFLTGSNALRMVIGYNGNVGIGTATPLNKLDVYGDLTIGNGADAALKYNSTVAGGGSEFVIQPIYSGTSIVSIRPAAGSSLAPALRLTDSSTDAGGSHAFSFGTGSASLPANVWNFFSTITGNANANSWPIYFGVSNPSKGRVVAMTIDNTANVGIGTISPTAVLHLKAGTATAGTAPVKFTTGTNLTTAEAGAFEYDGSSLFFTRSGALRAGLLMTDAASPFNTYSQSAKGATAFTSGTDNFLGGQLAGGALTAGSQNVLIGTQAGNLSNAGLSQAVFLGYFAGQSASGITTGSVFIGSQAGQNGAGSYNSNFVGQLAGFNASSAYHSNLFGYQAGYGINANNVNFFGQNAGYGATLANDTVGIGQNAGRNATGSIESIYLGKNTGYNSTGSGITGDYNIIVGSESGRNLTSGGKNILIGYNLNAQSAATDGQMTIGNLLFGTGIDGTGTTVSTGKIGIGTASPSYRFSVSDTTTAGIVGSFTNSDGTCTLDPGDVSGWSCPSDLNLKKDIETLASGSLDNILALRPVAYRLRNESNSTEVSTGLIAQEVQTVFPKLVKTQIDGTLALNYGGLTPYMISAIQEMNLKITEINDLEKENSWRDALIAWFGNTANGITKIYADVFESKQVQTDQLCIKDVCMDRDQLYNLMNQTGPAGNSTPPTPDPVVIPDIVQENPPVIDPIPEPAPDPVVEPEIGNSDPIPTE